MGKHNLYGYAMSKSLPMGRFEWVDPVKFNLDIYDDNSCRGCVLEVDLEYLKELHELHNDYPWASSKLKIEREMSDYQLKIADDSKIYICIVKKLVLTSLTKKSMSFITETFNFQLSTRIKYEKVHCVLKFDQSKWLKPYIQFNTQNRIEAEKMVARWKYILQINEQWCLF